MTRGVGGGGKVAGEPFPSLLFKNPDFFASLRDNNLEVSAELSASAADGSSSERTGAARSRGGGGGGSTDGLRESVDVDPSHGEREVCEALGEEGWVSSWGRT